MSESTPDFPLLDNRINMFLKQIVQKMKPNAIVAVRERVPIVNDLLMEEGCRRKFEAEGSFEELKGQDNVQLRGHSREFSQRMSMKAQIFLTQQGILLARNPAPFSSTSFLFHKSHSDCSCSLESYKFWKDHIMSIPAIDGVKNLAGSKIHSIGARDISDAEAYINAISHFKITSSFLEVRNCSPTAIAQLLSYLEPDMKPNAIVAVRERVPIVNDLLMKEACRR